jgi:cobalt-zinc-cadmium resistance protein CzcA
VDGIVDSTGFGGPTKIYLVELDPGRLRALGVSQAEVAQALAKSNDSTGGSYIISNDQRYMVRGIGLLRDIGDISSVVISSRADGVPVRVKDVATVSIGSALRKGQVGLNGDDDVVEGILMMRRGDNPTRVVANVMEAWHDIEERLPPGMTLKPLYDRTALVKKTVGTISRNVAEGVVLVVVILMLFLFQVRSALVCALVIPTALLFAFIILTVFNMPANLLSLGAIDFGIIVDGAVIMVENIMARLATHKANLAEPEQLKREIIAGALEVAKPIIFSTAIIVLSFLPILSFEHVEGRLFRPLAVMMNLTLLGAAAATLVVVPVACFIVYRLKLPSERESPVSHYLDLLYPKILKLALGHTTLTVASITVIGLACYGLIPFIGSEFVPELEEGNIWLTVTVIPPSVTLEKSVEIAGKLREVISSYPEVTNVLTQVGAPDDGTDPNPFSVIEVLVDLRPQESWREKFATKEELVRSLDRDLSTAVPGLNLNFSQYIKDNMDEAMSGVRNGQFAIKVFGADIAVLEQIASEIVAVMKSVDGMSDVANDALTGQPQVVISINQESASRFAVTADDVLDIVETSIGGKVVTSVVEGERSFDLVLRLEKTYRETPKRLGEILVTTPSGHRIPLKQIADIQIGPGANSIWREANRRRIAVFANIRGRDLGSAVLETQTKVKQMVEIPAGYKIAYAGEFERAKEAGERMAIIVPVTLAIIFLLLYFLFDSPTFAILAMSGVPLAASIGILVLFLTGTNLSISSGVGFTALFGLTIQNGVILMSKIKELIDSGSPAMDAVLQGSRMKLRPILIAVLVAAVGLAPAALSTGIGSQSQKPFAIVISATIIPATLLGMLLIPALTVLLLGVRSACKPNLRS